MKAKAEFRVAAMCGSLREGSYNRWLLNAVSEEIPAGFSIHHLPSLQDVPSFNQDLLEKPRPAIVKQLSDEIASSDALIIATPEYNYGVPGLLKNAIDWLSCPPDNSVFRHKAVALMGASVGNFGTVRAQLSLRQTFLFLDSHVVTKPEIYLARAQDKFSPEGRLVDEEARKLIRQQMVALLALSESTHR